jgi:hypothetical protein
MIVVGGFDVVDEEYGGFLGGEYSVSGARAKMCG